MHYLKSIRLKSSMMQSESPKIPELELILGTTVITRHDKQPDISPNSYSFAGTHVKFQLNTTS